MAKKANNKNSEKYFEKIIRAIGKIYPEEEKKKQEKYKKIELFLISLYTVATLIIAGVALTQIPDITKALNKPKILVKVNPYLENGYVPIDIFNFGDGPATNLSILIKSCYMENPFPYDIGTLHPGQDHKIQFKNTKTVEKFGKLDCQSISDFNISNYEVEIMTYKNIKTGRILKPSINESLDVCGYCFWDLTVTMDQGREDQRTSTYTPIPLLFSMEGDNVDFSDPNIIPYSPIKMAFFDKDILDKLNAID